jgi:hypothetical protein
MITILNRFPSQSLAEVSPRLSDTLRQLRRTVEQSGPLDLATCELISVSALRLDDVEAEAAASLDSLSSPDGAA